MYPIEEIAQRTGLTKRTIRYYEEIGILAPPERTGGGHRTYTDVHLKALDRILLFRETLGLSLADLKAYLSAREEVEALVPVVRQESDEAQKREHLDRIRTLLAGQKALIEAQLAKLRAAREETDRLIDRVDQAVRNLSEPS
jgi:DNA-binding transcriptional MerR regulator